MTNTPELYNIPFQYMYVVVQGVIPWNGADGGRIPGGLNDFFYLRIEISAWISEGRHGLSYLLLYDIPGQAYLSLSLFSRNSGEKGVRECM